MWDLPLRLYHWALALTVTGSFITIKMGEVEQHMVLGAIIIGLLVFRLLWGFVGTETSQFKNFLTPPGDVLADAKKLFIARQHTLRVGHSPLGGYATIIILLVLMIQAVMGLFANDQILSEGPLAYRVSIDISDTLTAYHKTWSTMVLSVIMLHLLAILYYQLLLRTGVLRPMITGGAGGSLKPDGPPQFIRFGFAVIIAVAVPYFIWSF